MEYYNLELKEAIEKAKIEAGIERKGDIKEMYENNKKIANKNLSTDEAQKDEFIKEQKRKFILEGIEKQTEEQKQKIYEYLEGRGLSKELADKYKMFYSEEVYEDKSTGTEGTPRLVFPIYLNEQPISYIARALINVEGKAKALNSAKTGIIPLNIEYLKEAPKQDKCVYICEGWADALSIEEAGKKAIALHSAQNTNKLKEYIKDNIETASQYVYILCCDNDEAGAKANIDLQTYCKEQKIISNILNIPKEYKDINEWYFAVHNKNTFKTAINPFKHETVFDYIDNSFLKDIKKMEQYKGRSTGFKILDKEINGVFPRPICTRSNKQFRKDNLYTSNVRPNGKNRRAYYIF